MPPTLVLLAGVAFVYYAFRTAPRRGVVAVAGLLWPTLWYMDCASREIGVWLVMWHIPVPGGGGGATDGSPVDAMFFGGLTLIGVVMLAKRNFSWGSAFRNNPWVTALLCFMALSILWSGYPYVSFKRYVKIIGSISMALVVLSNERPMEAIFTVLRNALYIHLPMSIICIKYFRDIGVSFDWSGASQAWQGISTSKNDLGQVALLGALYFSWDIFLHWRDYRWKNLHVVYLLMSVYLLKGSESEVSLTSVSVCVFALLVFLRLQSLRLRLPAARSFVLKVFWGTVTLVTLILVHSVVSFSPDSVFGHMISTFGRDITLTGRMFIWHDVYAAASVNPLLGVGFGGFWIGREVNIPWAAPMTWILGQAHDGYIDTYLQIGLIGVSLLAMVLFTTLYRLIAAMGEDFDFACFRITLFLTIVFINLTESTYLRGDHHLWFVMQLVIWILPVAPSAKSDPAVDEPAVSELEIASETADLPRAW